MEDLDTYFCIWQRADVTQRPNRPDIKGCKVGEKILCNRCLLKHEGRESGRGEMLYETITEPEHHHGEPIDVSTTNISGSERSTCSRGMGATIQKTNRTGLWYGFSHPVDKTIWKHRYGHNHPKDSGMVTTIQSKESCINNPRNLDLCKISPGSWIPTYQSYNF